MRVADSIRQKLTAGLAPTRLVIDDQSARHAGHQPDAAEESHFAVKVVSAVFSGKNRIERHRLIHGLLAEELAGGVHALAVTARSPEEDAA